jgi:hypothetical protein
MTVKASPANRRAELASNASPDNSPLFAYVGAVGTPIAMIIRQPRLQSRDVRGRLELIILVDCSSPAPPACCSVYLEMNLSV